MCVRGPRLYGVMVGAGVGRDQAPTAPRTISVRAVSGRTPTIAAGMDARHHDLLVSVIGSKTASLTSCLRYQSPPRQRRIVPMQE